MVHPTSIVAQSPGLSAADAQVLAEAATAHAQSIAPKLSGEGAGSLTPVWGAGWFGIAWARDYMWFQEAGIRPFTMRSLAGKIVPMWVPDPTGSEARKIPAGERARRTRRTVDGRRQVLIFRKVSHPGTRKRKVHPRTGVVRHVPASYPGAPGRIAVRKMAADGQTPTGKIAARNVGVRWRHPGITGRGFMRHSLEQVAAQAGLHPPHIHPSMRRPLQVR